MLTKCILSGSFYIKNLKRVAEETILGTTAIDARIIQFKSDNEELGR